MLKFGVVVQTDPGKGKVRVRFEDHDGLVSHWLPVVKGKTLRDKEYWMPDLNEQVACLMDENFEAGVVLGAVYSDADPVPVASQDKFHVRFDDGTTIEYDRAQHKLSAHVVGGTLEATVDVAATVTSPLITAVATTKVRCETPLLECTGNLVVNGGITCLGTYGSSGGRIQTPGDIKSTGGQVGDSVRNMSQDRAIYNGHTHPAPGGTTGAPSQQQ